MMSALRKLLGAGVRPVTHKDVSPAPRDQEIESAIREEHSKLVTEVRAVERRSWEIRQELAGNVLEIVSGEHR